MKRVIHVAQTRERLATGLRAGGFTTATASTIQPYRVNRHRVCFWWIDAVQDTPIMCAVKVYQRGHGEVRFGADEQFHDRVPQAIVAAFPTNALADKCRELTISHAEANSAAVVTDIGRLYATAVRGCIHRPVIFAQTPYFPDYSWSDAGLRQVYEGQLANARKLAEEERYIERQLRLGAEQYGRPDVMAEAEECARLAVACEKEVARKYRELADLIEKGQLQ